MRARLQKLQNLVVGVPILLQKIAIARVFKDALTLPGRLPGQHVAVRPDHLEQLRACLLSQGELIEICAQRSAVMRIFVQLLPRAEGAAHQTVDAEHLFLEEYALVQVPTSVEPLIESLVETLHVDAEILEQTLGGAVPLARRTVDRLSAPVADEGLSVDDEFVPLGVAAEIVVGIQDQYTGVRAALPVEVCRGQAADAGADHG